MSNFWDFEVWSWILLFGVLLGSLLVANVIKKAVPFLRESLIPTSVLGGILLLIISSIYTAVTSELLFDSAPFAGKGMATLEIITYHALALGFIASAFKTTGGKLTKARAEETLNTGVTTVATYLLQASVGLGVTLLAALVVPGLFSSAGILLPFGFGQGTGQALNYGTIYETQNGFVGGKNFGLTIAALGFLAASVGGVIHLIIMKRTGKLVRSQRTDGSLHTDRVESAFEIPMQESIDKMTVQIALILVAYLGAYGLMLGLGALLPGMKSVIFGFNFLLGVLVATLIKVLLNFLRKKRIVKKKYTNNFLMTRASNFFFDIMVVAGIAAIRLDILENYWGVILILAVVGTAVTYLFNRFVAKRLFPDYAEEQFLAMYGMLTGTASTGIILLREVDKDFRTPASDNLVYQNFPAIVLGFPIMLIAPRVPDAPVPYFFVLLGLFGVLCLVLFRKYIFRKKGNKTDEM
ncbi:MAG: hypothetical protein IJV96_01370 [Clostridia bacterium]|nr:hypothetical protein [Clostridia bacterium]